jgi:hypothetical protein
VPRIDGAHAAGVVVGAGPASAVTALALAQRFLPRGERYEIRYRGLYGIHQRVASRFGAGQVFLAGDAAPRDPATRRARLDELRAICADPVRHKAFLRRSSLIESVRKAAGID